MNLFVAPFRFDVTPPMGHPLCGGWIAPVSGYDDSLEAIGLVIHGAGSPIVLCAVDWTGILNEAHVAWRTALADAAHTTPDRVAVHCVHQHNAPFVCLASQRLVAEQADLSAVVDVGFFETCLERGRGAIEKALAASRPLTGIAVGKGRVEQVAANRRILGGDGKVAHWRGSSCTDAKLRSLPEGLIDPFVRTVALYDGDFKVAALHYYATHPMSYYGDGRVSSDFAGLARKRRQSQEEGCTHIYWTGCAGNIAAGKYNDGSKQARVDLTNRLFEGICRSEEQLKPEPIDGIDWKTTVLLPPARSTFVEKELERVVSDSSSSKADRARSAMKLSWMRRVKTGSPEIVVSALHANDVSLLHLPSESFLEYQLRASAISPDRFVATAAYGDGGPWYIPIREAYPQGGYEVNVAFCDPEVDDALTGALKKVLSVGATS